jgi:hypothetical protein
MSLPKGTKLQNKRSKKIITIIESFSTVTEESNWQPVICYRCYVKKGQFKYLYEYDLGKYEVLVGKNEKA